MTSVPSVVLFSSCVLVALLESPFEWVQFVSTLYTLGTFFSHVSTAGLVGNNLVRDSQPTISREDLWMMTPGPFWHDVGVCRIVLETDCQS